MIEENSIEQEPVEQEPVERVSQELGPDTPEGLSFGQAIMAIEQGWHARFRPWPHKKTVFLHANGHIQVARDEYIPNSREMLVHEWEIVEKPQPKPETEPETEQEVTE